MKVIVLDNKDFAVEYHFNPEHKVAIWDFYMGLVDSGKIKAFSAVLDGKQKVYA